MRRAAIGAVLGAVLVAAPAYGADPGKVEAIAQQGLMIENDQALGAIPRAIDLAELFMRQKPQQPINQLIFIRAIRKLNAVSPLPGYSQYLATYRRTVAHYRRQHGHVRHRRHRLLDAPGSLAGVVYMWPFAQVITAELELGKTASMAALRYYYDRKARAFAVTARIKRHRVVPIGANFCDDNDWGGLAYEQAWKLTHKASYLRFAKIIAQYENHRCWNKQYGGERWLLDPSNYNLSAVSTAGGEQLDLRLYHDTGNRRYLTYAMRADAWMRSKMLAPNGGYYDHITIKAGGGTTFRVAAHNHHEAPRREIDVLSYYVAKLQLR